MLAENPASPAETGPNVLVAKAEKRIRVDSYRECVCSWGSVRSIKNDVFRPNEGCHSGFNEDDHRAKVLYNLTQTQAKEASKNEEAIYAFYAWLFGPWTPYKFVLDGYQNTIEDVMRYGYILTAHQKAPMNLVYNFLIAMRFPTEHGYAMDQWWSWVQAGVHPGLAYWATYTAGIRNPNSNHQSFDWMNTPDEYIVNLCNGIIAHPRDTPRPCNMVWGDTHVANGTHKSWSERYKDMCTGKTIVGGGDYNWETRTYGDRTVYTLDDKNILPILLKEQERLGLKTPYSQEREQAPTPSPS